ncbi:MAG TPA: hypothetical protein PLZ43_14490 [bacterium]|nr:hypothetical protein [bacterium]
MSEFKYHVGFPVDCEKDPKYYLLYPIKIGTAIYHWKCKIEKEDTLEEWKDSPSSFNTLDKLLQNKRMLFHCSSGNFNFSGNSGDLAYFIAGLSSNIAEPNKDCPFFFFSVALKTKPTHDKITDPFLSVVTENNYDTAVKSLKNKWEIISKLSKKKKVVFFLHQGDWKNLKNQVDEKEYVEFELNPNRKNSDLSKMVEEHDLVVVYLGEHDIGLLLNLLEIDENKHPKSFAKFFGLFLLIVTVGVLSIGGYFYYENKKAEEAKQQRCEELSNKSDEDNSSWENLENFEKEAENKKCKNIDEIKLKIYKRIDKCTSEGREIGIDKMETEEYQEKCGKIKKPF